MNKLYYLGPEGSFSHILAKQLELNSELVPAESFRQASESALADNAQALLVIENSITSDVHEAVDIIFEGNYWIKAEAYLQIKLALLALENSNLEDIEIVSSKLPALNQCSKFISERKLKTRLAESTSSALQEIVQANLRNVSAIGSASLINQYSGVKVLLENIGNSSHNFTRFVVIEKRSNQTIKPEDNRVTFLVELPHISGSLAKFLTGLAELNANLTRIESRPVAGTDFEYSFWIDLEAKSENLQGILEWIPNHTTRFDLLGAYQKGKTYSS